MGTLWTPSGEHEPSGEERGERPSPPPSGPAPGAGAPGSTGEAPDPEEVEAVRRMHGELRSTPVADVVANHAVGLFQLGLIHLGLVTPPDEHGRVPAPDLAAAGVAIDAMAALVDGLGARLGEHEATLREALSQIQTAYAQVADAQEPGSTG